MTTSVVETTTTTTAAAETTISTSDAPVATGRGGDSCVVGAWEVDSQGFFDRLSGSTPDQSIPLPEAIFVRGSYTIAFAPDGSYLSDRDQWTFEIGSGEGTIRLTIDGEVPGTWSTEGDVLTVEEGEGDIVVSGVVDQDGTEFPIPMANADTFTAPAFAESGTYECDGDLLTLTVEGFTTTLSRA